MALRLFSLPMSASCHFRFIRNTALLPIAASTVIVLALLLSATTSRAALSVGLGGLSPQTFDTQPPATSWSTFSIAGASTSPEDAAGLDVVVQTVAATSIAAQVGSSALDPPGAAATAQWSSVGHYLQTLPTGNAVTLLMATLQNDSGGNINGFNITYELTVKNVPAAETVPGHRVYYSFTGASNTWVLLGGFGANVPSGSPQSINIFVNLAGTPWAPGGTLFILFADDNSVPGPDAANAIDNFAIPVGDFFAPVITQQPTNQTATAGSAASFSVLANGTPPLNYQWRFQGTPIYQATNRILSLTNVQATNGGPYDVIVNNSFGSVTSTVATLTVLIPPGITTQPQSTSAQAGDTVMFTVVPTGAPPLSFQWRLNGTNIPGATGQTLTITNGQFANVGNYSVVVSNAVGTITSSNAVLWFMAGIDLYPGLPIYGPLGAQFQVQYTTNLAATNATWTVLTNLALPTNPYLFIDPVPARPQRRIYRAVLVP